MFDKKTKNALAELSEEDLYKVSKMIQKLARKNSGNKNAEENSEKKSKAQKKEEDGFLHKIERQTGSTKTEPFKKVEGRNNLFNEMPERNHHKKDTEIDKKLSIRPPSERNTRSNLVSVQCQGCGKKQEIASVLVPQEIDRYTCNACQVRGMKK
tara:strand:+ start:191 stop:652 length:462 start_codon:yes stop_codon:yes gene_type:complete